MTPCRSILLALALAASLGRAYAGAPDDEAALRNADENWAKAAQTKQVAAWVAFYADDAVVLPPNDKMASNRQDIAKSIGDLLALPALALNWQPAKVETAKSGDLGYVQGTYTVSFRNPKGETVNDRGKYLEVWRKQPDGNWKCIVDTWNSDLP